MRGFDSTTVGIVLGVAILVLIDGWFDKGPLNAEEKKKTIAKAVGVFVLLSIGLSLILSIIF